MEISFTGKQVRKVGSSPKSTEGNREFGIAGDCFFEYIKLDILVP